MLSQQQSGKHLVLNDGPKMTVLHQCRVWTPTWLCSWRTHRLFASSFLPHSKGWKKNARSWQENISLKFSTSAQRWVCNSFLLTCDGESVQSLPSRHRPLISASERLTDQTCWCAFLDRYWWPFSPALFVLIIIIVMEIYAAPKLPKYMTALGACNVKFFTYEINQHMHEHTHKHVRARTCTHTRTHTQACSSKKFIMRKICQRNKSRRLETLLKEMGFQSLSRWCLRVRMVESVW